MDRLAAPAAQADDPVFAAIAASREAERTVRAFYDDPSAKSKPNWQQLEDVLTTAQTQTYNAVWAVVPTTHAGRLALVEYAEFQSKLYHGADWQDRAKQDVFGDIAQALAAAIRAERVEAAPVSPALADLIARHRTALDRANSTKGLTDEEAHALDDEAWDLFRQACAFPVAGPADFAAKIGLAAPEIRAGLTTEPGTNTSLHALDCIAADMASGRPMTTLFEPEAAIPDLSAAPIWQIARLYEHLESLTHVASMACNAPMSWDSKRESYSSIGSFLEDEVERLDALSSRVADQIRGRTPADSGEHKDRAATIVKDQFSRFSGIDDPALAAEIKEAWGL